MIKSFAFLLATTIALFLAPVANSAPVSVAYSNALIEETGIMAMKNSAIIVTQFDTGEIIYYMQFYIENFDDESNEVQTIKNNYLFREEKNCKILNDKGKEVKYDYYAEFLPVYNRDSVEIWLMFNNYYSFARFNDINPAEKSRPEPERKTTLLFRETTQDLQNPWTKYFSNNKCSGLIGSLNTVFTGRNAMIGIDCGYLFSSSVRRTKVYDYDRLMRADDGSYNYYFTASPARTDSVIIFDRTANTPVWYGIAITVTLVAASIFYFILRRRSEVQALR